MAQSDDDRGIPKRLRGHRQGEAEARLHHPPEHSATGGQLIFDDSVGKATYQELYSTMTGGESWEIKQKSTKVLASVRAFTERWSVTAPMGSATYLIERIVNGKKESVARFLIHIGDCK